MTPLQGLTLAQVTPEVAAMVTAGLKARCVALHERSHRPSEGAERCACGLASQSKFCERLAQLEAESRAWAWILAARELDQDLERAQGLVLRADLLRDLDCVHSDTPALISLGALSAVQTTARALSAMLTHEDDPDLDGTDGAHPAWWRGHERGCEGMKAALVLARAETAALRQALAASWAASPAAVPDLIPDLVVAILAKLQREHGLSIQWETRGDRPFAGSVIRLNEGAVVGSLLWSCGAQIASTRFVWASGSSLRDVTVRALRGLIQCASVAIGTLREPIFQLTEEKRMAARERIVNLTTAQSAVAGAAEKIEWAWPAAPTARAEEASG